MADQPSVLKIKIGPLWHINAVRQDDGYLLVLQERGAVDVRRRIPLTKTDAMRLAQFLAGIEVGPGPPPRAVTGEEPTDPGGELPLPRLPSETDKK